MNKLFFVPIVLATLCGCQSQPEPDTKVEATRLQAAQSMRQIFDKVRGDYNALTPADKEELLKQFNGNEANAQKSWEMMKMGAGGASATPPAGSTP